MVKVSRNMLLIKNEELIYLRSNFTLARVTTAYLTATAQAGLMSR